MLMMSAHWHLRMKFVKKLMLMVLSCLGRADAAHGGWLDRAADAHDERSFAPEGENTG